jgi:hypothetical protein
MTLRSATSFAIWPSYHAIRRPQPDARAVSSCGVATPACDAFEERCDGECRSIIEIAGGDAVTKFREDFQPVSHKPFRVELTLERANSICSVGDTSRRSLHRPSKVGLPVAR